MGSPSDMTLHFTGEVETGAFHVDGLGLIDGVRIGLLGSDLLKTSQGISREERKGSGAHIDRRICTDNSNDKSVRVGENRGYSTSGRSRLSTPQNYASGVVDSNEIRSIHGIQIGIEVERAQVERTERNR